MLAKLSGSWEEKKPKCGVLDTMTNSSRHEKEDRHEQGIQKDEWDGVVGYMRAHKKDFRLSDKDIDVMDAEGCKNLKD